MSDPGGNGLLQPVYERIHQVERSAQAELAEITAEVRAQKDLVLGQLAQIGAELTRVSGVLAEIKHTVDSIARRPRRTRGADPGGEQ